MGGGIMYYLFIVNTTTGAIGANSSTHSPMISVTTTNPDGTVTTTTEPDPNLIPSGCVVLGPLKTLDTTQEQVFANPALYLYQNGKFVDNPNAAQIQLQNAKQEKIKEVTDAYQTELNGTFTSSATGTALVYDFSSESQNLWKELSDAITANYIPDTAFPMNITLANGTNVAHMKLQLQQIFGEITARKLQLYSKFQGMVTVAGSILSATTVADVQAISW